MRHWPMKKLLGVILAALVIALAIWVAWRVQQANREMQVSELLPKTTVFLAEMPDLKQAREQWRKSDIYALWHEPAVQAWLQKPLAGLAKHSGDRAEFERFMQLEPTSLFVALSSFENNDARFLAGFHFEKAESDARRFVEGREAPLLAKSGSAKRETITYQQHQIETVNAGRFALATVFDRNWFFASNNLAALKALLDRADRRTPEAGRDVLRESEVFQTALKHLPKDAAARFFVDPQPFLARLAPLFTMTGQSAAADRLQQLKSIRSFAGALGFDDGKMRETLYAQMPAQHPGEKLAESALASAGKDTFLYSASLASWPDTWNVSNPVGTPGLPPYVVQAADALKRAGVSAADLKRAFGNNVELIGSWLQDVHWPQLAVLLPVQDATLAHKALDALSTSGFFGTQWTRREKEDVTYYDAAGFGGGMVAIHPTLALSSRMLALASDASAAESLLNPANVKPSESLKKADTFTKAEGLVGPADTGFGYLDTRMLFERADAAVRPLLLMSATFYPALGKKIDVSKLPPAEVIAKHLSPIVLSQRWIGDGYLTESVGPVTVNEAALTIGAAMAAGYIYYQRGVAAFHPPTLPAPASSTPVPPLTPSPTPIPTPP